jgi:ubiquinone/menaquinone biosynthesis C-methylase UbiE
MADLSRYDDASFDLVYSGQTIEHVTPADCDLVLAEVLRVLRPGGWFYVDTPNGPVCRLQSDDFINPDHKVEYGHEEFLAKLTAVGFDVPEQYGLNYAGPSVERGVFDERAVAAAGGIYADPARCYLLAYGARRPA